MGPNNLNVSKRTRTTHVLSLLVHNPGPTSGSNPPVSRTRTTHDILSLIRKPGPKAGPNNLRQQEN